MDNNFENLKSENKKLKKRIKNLEKEINKYKAMEEECLRLKSIVEQTSDFVSTSTPDKKLTFINKAGINLVGWNDKKIEEYNIKDLHPKWAYDIVNNIGVKAAIENGFWEGDTALVHSDGREIPVSQVIISHKDDKGNLKYLSTIMRDLTKRKQAENALAKTQGLLKAAIEQSTAGIIIADAPNVKIILANPAAFSIRGETNKKLTEIELNEHAANWHTFHPNGTKFDSEDLPLSKAILTGETQKNVEALIRREDGEERFIIANAAPVKNSDNEIIAGVVVFLDITERKLTENERNALINKLEDINLKLETALQKAEEANKAKSDFLAIISHELRTPLTSIIGFSQLLTMDDELNEDEKRYVNFINKSSNKLLNVLSDILQISVLEIGKINLEYKKFNLEEIINDILYLFSNEIEHKNIEIICNLNNNVEILSDASRIRQILLNLIGNAIKFTNKGKVEIEVKKSYNEYQFTVSDTGIGIELENINDIFEMFKQVENSYTRRYQGVGLGLAICKKLVKALKGEIWVESKKNEGSTFYFKIPLPLSDDKNKNLKKNIEDINMQGMTSNKKIKVLFAEDDETNFELIKQFFLQYKNIEFKGFYDGTEVIKEFKKNPDYNLVLLDIQMPKLNGVECLEEIRKIDKNIPVIALTAFAMSTDKNKFVKIGFNDYISKPIKEEIFFETIFDHV